MSSHKPVYCVKWTQHPRSRCLVFYFLPRVAAPQVPPGEDRTLKACS